MKHLKRFNEELNIYTYRKAAKKLAEIGHKKRSATMQSWIDIKQKELDEKTRLDEIEHWRDSVSRFSPFGKLKFEISLPSGSRSKPFEQIVDDFYGSFAFEPENFTDTVEYELKWKRDLPETDLKKNDPLTFWAQLFLVAIPTTRESYDKYQSIPAIKSSMWRGGIFGMWISFKIQIAGDLISIQKVEIWEDDGQEIRLKIADRATAGKIRSLLLGIFKGTIDYPVKYQYKEYPTNLHDLIETIVCNKSGLTSDYGLNMDHFVEAIQKISANSIFKEG